MIVLDASVVVKLFKDEADSPLARSLADQEFNRDEPVLAPGIMIYEVFASALNVRHPFGRIVELLDRLRLVGLRVEEPNHAELLLAEKITTSKAPGGGFPTLFDSIYHAMAIERGGTFVTADVKHVGKTRHLGHVLALSEWRAEQH